MSREPDVFATLRQAMNEQIDDGALFDAAREYAGEYMQYIRERRVYPEPEAIQALKVFDEPLPESGEEPGVILERLHSHGSPATVAQTGGRYFGFVCGSATPVALAAKWLGDVWDQNPAMFVLSPTVAKLEHVCQEWLKDLFGLGPDVVAGFVSGTSTGTMCGLAAGRWNLLGRLGWDVNRQGMVGAPKLRVIVSAQAHGTVFKALALLGFGADTLERAPVDDQGRIVLDSFPELDDHCLVVLQAGNVNTGAFDPIDAICDRARKAEAWVHVDGAFGLWAVCSPNTRELVRGIDKADSLSVDAHKTLNVPYDCGIVLCRHGQDLVGAMQLSGEYIQYSDSRDNMMFVQEMSRRNRVVELWATMKYLGKSGIRALVEELCAGARRFGKSLEDAGFTVLNQVVFNQVLFACETPETTTSVLREIQLGEDCWCSGSTWNNQPAIRLSVCSWATTPEDIRRSVDAFARARENAK